MREAREGRPCVLHDHTVGATKRVCVRAMT